MSKVNYNGLLNPLPVKVKAVFHFNLKVSEYIKGFIIYTIRIDLVYALISDQ